MSGFVGRAILLGVVIDNIGTLIVTGLYDALVAQLSGATSNEDLTLILEGSIPLQTVQLALGLSFTAIGAYVAAQIAKGNERANAFAVGLFSTLIGFLFVFASPESAPFWAEAVGLLLTIPAAFLGGEIRLLVVRMGRR